MENLVIEKGIQFHSLDYSDAYVIDIIKIEFNSEDIENIKKAINIFNENKYINNIRIDIKSRVTYLDSEVNLVEDWKRDVQEFIIYPDSIFYYAQNKYDCGDQIESEEIKLTELGII